MVINSIEDILKIKNADEMLSDEVFNYLIELDTINFEKSIQVIKAHIKNNKKTLNCLNLFNALLKEKQDNKKADISIYTVEIPEKELLVSFKMQNYYIDEENNEIVKKSVGKKVDEVICTSLIFPYSIIADIQTNAKMIDLLYLDSDFVWKTTRENFSSITSSYSITSQIGRVFTGITSNNAKELINFFQEILRLNPKMFIPKKSACHFGWLNETFTENDIFLPFDEICEFSEEGNENKRIYESLTKPKGSFANWKKITEKLRKNIPMRLSIDLSIASPLLHILDLDSFTFLLYGGSGLGKSKCQQAAMTVWGNPDGDVGLKFPMRLTDNYLGVLAGTLKNIPVCIDELKTYKGDLNTLIYNYSLNKEKGRATVSNKTNKIITQTSKTWKTPLIISGEFPIMEDCSDAGALNRLLEIEVKENTMEDFHKDTPILLKNYGWAGTKIIKYIKTITKSEWESKFWEIQEDIIHNINTTEKQANLMAVILLGDFIARELFYKDEKPLSIDDYGDFLYSAEQVSLGNRAYKEVIGLISSHQDKFFVENSSGFIPPSGREFWGEISSNQIKILRSKLTKLLKAEFDEKCSPNQIIKEWNNLGYLQLTTAKKPIPIHQTTVQKRKGNYIWLNIIGDYDDGLKEQGKILSIDAHKQREQQLKDIQTKHLNEMTGENREYKDYFMGVNKKGE